MIISGIHESASSRQLNAYIIYRLSLTFLLTTSSIRYQLDNVYPGRQG
jgi:hypothetical protein